MKSYLVDTCGWIEWLSDTTLADSFKPYLKKPSHIIVPTLIQYELYKWVCREKDVILALEIVGVTEKGNVIPLDTALALYAADIAKEYQLAMADAVVYSTAQRHGVALVTCDQHFAKLPDVIYFKK